MVNRKTRNKQRMDALWQVPWALRQSDLAAALQHQISKTDWIDEMLDLDESDAELEISVEDGIAHLAIEGVIGNRLPVWMQKFFGYTSIDVVDDALDAIEGNEAIKALVLEIDSPGGTVSGVPELAERIGNMSIPVIAYTPSLMASAAYWIGSSADEVIASKSAIVGSIGVYLPAITLKGMYDQMGVNVDLIKAGKYKGALYPGTELTDEQRDDLQSGVDYVYGLFAAQVARREVDQEDMQGQDFYADQAIERNLVDHIGSIDSAFEAAARLIKTGQTNQP